MPSLPEFKRQSWDDDSQIIESDRFVYQPPAPARTAHRILVKPNLGYPGAAPITVSMAVLAQVLQQLRHHNPEAEILVVEGVCSPMPLIDIASRHGLFQYLDAGMQLLDADDLPSVEYPNRSPQPVRFTSMWAPALLQAVDCRLTIGAFKKTHLKGEALISASLKNLYGLFPRARYKARSPNSRGQLHRPSVPLVLQDVYGCIGHLFDGAVVDATEQYISPDWKPDRPKAGVPLGKVIWGTDMIQVDRTACQVAGEPIPSYLDAIATLRQALIPMS